MVNGFCHGARCGPWLLVLVAAMLLAGCSAVGDRAAEVARPGAVPPAGGPAAVHQPVQPPSQGPVESAAVRRLAGGSLDARVERGVYLATTAAQWPTLWARLFGGGTPVPVDFDREVAVVAAQGEQRTGGYWVKVSGATWDGPVLRLQVEEGRPAPGVMVTQVITHPYDVVAVTRPANVQPAAVRVEAQWKPAR